MCGVGLRYTVDRENVARIRGVRNPTVKSVVSREAWLRPTRYDIYILYIYIYILTKFGHIQSLLSLKQEG